MRLFLLSLFSFFSLLCFAQNNLTVTPASQPPYDPNTLIDNFFTGAGIDVLSVQFAGDSNAVGFFSDGASAVGINRGLLLTSGSAATTSALDLGGEETGIEFASTDNSSTALLPALQNISTYPLYDVVYYKITFRPSSDSIRFRYVFASEEYPEYACTSFNDIFGFFLSGPQPGGTGSYADFNIALIPGTNLPVAINNLHPANPGNTDCPPFNVQYYHDNNNSNLQPVYDGFTDVFVAEAAVIPCETYEMTIAIADVGDGVFDTGVFLEGNSFGGAIDVSASFGAAENVIPENATADTIAITFANIPAATLPLTVTIGGQAENGVDYQQIPAQYTINSSDGVLYLLFQPIPDTLSEGIENVVIDITGPGCLAKQFTLYLSDADSSMLQGDPAMYALVNGNAHLEVQPTSFSGKTYTFSNDEDLPVEPVGALVTSEIEVSLPFAHLNDVRAIQSVCFDAEHAWVDDLNVFLISPDNRFVELTTNNGGNGDNYTGTCFTPEATNPVNAPGPFAPPDAAPFTGTFKAEGEWKDIVNTPVTGIWKLGLTDDNAGFTGTLKNWSIQFSGLEFGSFKYLWNTGDTTRSIDVSAAGTYTVQVSNAVSHFEHTFIVTEEVVTAVSSPVAASLTVQPNPAREFVQISWGKDLKVNNVRVFDHFGKLVMAQKVSTSSQSETLATGNLQTGTYLISLDTNQGNLVRKVVKE
jgi:subtilisin-like proprotein convertase family protein